MLWGLIILQTSGIYPQTFPSWMPGGVVEILQKLGDWAVHKPMDDVCWISFCSLSIAYFVESFVRKLDELANGAMEEPTLGRQISPFNFVCVSTAHLFIEILIEMLGQGRTFFSTLSILINSLSRTQTRQATRTSRLARSYHNGHPPLTIYNLSCSMHIEEIFQSSTNSNCSHIVTRSHTFPCYTHSTRLPSHILSFNDK